MGIILAFISTFLHAAKDLVSKKVAFSIDGTTSTFASFAYALPFYGLFMVVAWYFHLESFSWTGSFLLLVLLRSISDAGAEWTKMHSLSLGEISLVAPFLSLAPLFLLILSPLITGEVPSWLGALGVLLSVVGSIHVAQGTSLKVDPKARKAVFFALLCAICFAFNSCFDRLAVQVASPLLSGFTMTLLCALFFAPVVLFKRERRAMLREGMTPLLGRGVLEVAFMVTKLWALQYLQAPYVAALGRFAIVLSVVGGRFFFKEVEFERRMGGALIITLGAVLVIWESI